MIKMNPAEFIVYCEKAGIKIQSISEIDVVLYTGISRSNIDFDLVNILDPKGPIRDLLRKRKRVEVIKTIRSHTDLSLKDAFDLGNDAWETWTMGLVHSIPFEDLPLHLKEENCEDYKNAILKRLKGN